MPTCRSVRRLFDTARDDFLRSSTNAACRLSVNTVDKERPRSSIARSRSDITRYLAVVAGVPVAIVTYRLARAT